MSGVSADAPRLLPDHQCVPGLAWVPFRRTYSLHVHSWYCRLQHTRTSSSTVALTDLLGLVTSYGTGTTYGSTCTVGGLLLVPRSQYWLRTCLLLVVI